MNTLSDTEWVDRLTELEQDMAIELRQKKEYSFESPWEILSVYNRFRMYAGGWVMNYSLSNITDYYDSLLSFPDQSIYLLDQEGNLLLQCDNSDNGGNGNNGNDKISSETLQALRIQDRITFGFTTFHIPSKLRNMNHITLKLLLCFHSPRSI